jgi:hypothetical protein
MAIRKAQTAAPSKRTDTRSKPKSDRELEALHEKFLKSEKGSAEYERAGNDLMNKVFSGK